MYQYDEFDQDFVSARASEFRGQVTRRLAEIGEDSPASAKWGLFAGMPCTAHCHSLRGIKQPTIAHVGPYRQNL